MMRIERMTSPLPRECSTTEPHGHSLRFVGAGEGNRTLVVSLEGFCSTIELHPLKQKAFEPNAFVGNLMVEGDGFEPS